MPRPFILSTLCVIAFSPSSLRAQYRGACPLPSRTANIVVTGHEPRFLFGGMIRRLDVVFGGRYFNLVPLAGAPYSLPPATVFQPFVYAPPIYSGQPFYTTQSYVPVPTIPSHDSKQVNRLFNEVERLRRKVQRLQEKQQPLRQGLQAAPEPQPQSAKETSLPVILVFRDGHQMEVQGYAIVGEILWAVTKQTSTKVSLSDLDLEATQKLNTERGVRFPPER